MKKKKRDIVFRVACISLLCMGIFFAILYYNARHTALQFVGSIPTASRFTLTSQTIMLWGPNGYSGPQWMFQFEDVESASMDVIFQVQVSFLGKVVWTSIPEDTLLKR